MTQSAFHPSVLTYWRRRLAASDRPYRIFDAVTTVITESGAVSGRRRRAIDSTILDDPAARDALVSALVNDALTVLAALDGVELTAHGQFHMAVNRFPLGPFGSGRRHPQSPATLSIGEVLPLVDPIGPHLPPEGRASDAEQSGSLRPIPIGDP
ncbi:hypothetical protein GCM10023152_20800 [Agromyces bauzanensis]|uniref:Uncharacterized protein n=1 Tax=Agromyces bauzanensis TaxID=1308924 RepID=A0A917UU50_9MICO|nr:hypothetical protein GCM10011372_24540 [Agromyces bauzanensis]